MQLVCRRDFEAAKGREDSMRAVANALIEVYQHLSTKKKTMDYAERIAEAKQILDREANVIGDRLKTVAIKD